MYNRTLTPTRVIPLARILTSCGSEIKACTPFFTPILPPSMGETPEQEGTVTSTDPATPTTIAAPAVLPTSSMGTPVAFHWKYVSLVVLVFQNTALVLTMRYSRTIDGPKYLASTAVVLMEILKLTASTLMELYHHRWDLQATISTLRVEVVENFEGMVKISVPSVLYTIQNNLLYLALSHLDAATFQV